MMQDTRQDDIRATVIEAARELHVRSTGPDRPNLISTATTRLEEHGLYVDSITFSLALSGRDRYEMELVAKGDLDEIRRVDRLIDEDDFFPIEIAGPERTFHWPSAYMLHVGMDTPDEPGLTAKISRIVGKEREGIPGDVCPCGSFVHLMGLIHNSNPPHFVLRANIAAQTREVQQQIADHLHAWAGKHRYNVWTCDLNPGGA